MAEFAEGWYVPTPDPKGRKRYPRWLLGEINGLCRYSKGGTRHFVCKVSTFKRWLKAYGAHRRSGNGEGSQK